jgi:protein TonB
LLTYIQPEYPPIAVAARVSGQVSVEATIRIDGGPASVRVTKSIPLLDQAVLDAVRRWRFAPPTVNGISRSVIVPIHVTFPEYGTSQPISSVRSPSLPSDFAVVFASICPDGRHIEFNTATGAYVSTMGPVTVSMALSLSGSDLETLHDALAQGGAPTTGIALPQWPDALPETQMSDQDIRVFVPGKRSVFGSSSNATPRQYFLDVRMNGTWTRVAHRSFYASTRPGADVDRRISQITRAFGKRVESAAGGRLLPRNHRWCKWPD